MKNPQIKEIVSKKHYVKNNQTNPNSQKNKALYNNNWNKKNQWWKQNENNNKNNNKKWYKKKWKWKPKKPKKPKPWYFFDPYLLLCKKRKKAVYRHIAGIQGNNPIPWKFLKERLNSAPKKPGSLIASNSHYKLGHALTSSLSWNASTTKKLCRFCCNV
jgi:hypothetical protein